ncbi:hypothetical protein ABZ832_28770 [Streptantibioticus parmotrematis]|uniref:hypothetical protein n=1 Tax=Streptantibioticus parmotrematis TaxID=2873249 RepID=UPI0033EF46F2
MAGIISDAGSLANQITNLLVGAVMALICVASVVTVFAKTRSVVQSFVMAIAACALWFVVMHMVTFRDAAGQDLTHPGAISAVSQRVGQVR